MYQLSDRAVESVHRSDRLLGQALDVAALRHRNRAVAKDGLDGVVIDAQVVQVRRQTPPKSVPTFPLGTRGVPHIFVILCRVLSVALPAFHTPIEGRENVRAKNV